MADEKDYDMQIMKKKNQGKSIEKREWHNINCVIGTEDYKKTILEMEGEYEKALDDLEYAKKNQKKSITDLFKPSLKKAGDTVDIKCTKLDLLYYVIQQYARNQIISTVDLQNTINNFIAQQDKKTEGYGLKLNQFNEQNVVFDKYKRTLNILFAINQAVGGDNYIEFLPEPLQGQRRYESTLTENPAYEGGF